MKILNSYNYLTVSKSALKAQQMKWAKKWTEAGGNVKLTRKKISHYFTHRRIREKRSVGAREHLESGDVAQEIKETTRLIETPDGEMKQKEAEKKPEALKQTVIKLDVMTLENEEDLLNSYTNTKVVTVQNMMSWSQKLGISIHTVLDWVMNQKTLENSDDVGMEVEEEGYDEEDTGAVEVEEEEILEAEEDEEYDKKDKENLTDEGEEPDNECLLLINRSKSDCFMNTIANLLYSCKGVRAVIRNADLYRENSPLKNILLKLFRKESNSTREWRETLQDVTYHFGHQDVGEIFEVLIEDLCKDINLRPMKFKTATETKCKFCGNSQISTTIQHFSILNLTRHETFEKLFTEEYAPQPASRCSCGGENIEKKSITPLGPYHFMVIRHEIETFSDLKSDDTFQMFRCSWRIKSFAEYLPAKKGRKGEKGHYVAWINTGVDWMCVNDSNNKFRRKDLDLSEMYVNLIAFEKFDRVKKMNKY
ncbi:hypothetical protein CAEBREN_00727 [Caenorhabditis brenneri]|uniref:USP domain-containing protein n=1 Tax=Caenorhabditis brenneri TaxID=135651 RepID=G0PE86_CAEBE|nr:hypothetical protein CAEBREN_00727 [Caenorhabditis brenneri]